MAQVLNKFSPTKPDGVKTTEDGDAFGFTFDLTVTYTAWETFLIIEKGQNYLLYFAILHNPLRVLVDSLTTRDSLRTRKKRKQQQQNKKKKQ